MKAVITLLIVIFLAAVVTSAGIEDKRQNTGEVSVPSVQREVSIPDSSSSGIGITYGGKMGIEIAPGLVLDFDGNLSPGFGF